MTERQFMECLRPRFGGDDFALVPQVRNGTGFQRRTRTADAIAISLWPSRGVDAHGFEFKDSRSDWKKELDSPEKSEEIGRYCRFWWLVVSDPAIVKDGELPSAWGLLHATDGGTKVVVKAPGRTTQEPSWSFVAAVLKAAKDVATGEDVIQERIKAAVAKEQQGRREAIEAARKDGGGAARKELERLQGVVAEFEAAAGIKITDRWGYARDAARTGAAVRFLIDGGLAGLQDQLRRIAGQCDTMKAAAMAGIGEVMKGDE